jgi:alkylhydroperoxidase family enzyme
MARIPPLEYEQAQPAAQRELDHQLAHSGRLTNMKRTLAHSPPALHALMQWYPLHDEVQTFLGQRLTTLFAHAVSTQTDCLICSTFFRRLLLEAGEQPDHPTLDEREQVVLDYGRQLARDAHGVSDDLYERLRRFLQPAQIVALTALGGMMIATNLFNNALRVDLDTYLHPYRKPSREG